MKIKFNGHIRSQREVELTQQDLAQLFDVMRKEFVEHITYSTFARYRATSTEKSITEFCDKFGVDVEDKKDRCTFFQSVLENLVNPYE
jgi:hypothetical protein